MYNKMQSKTAAPSSINYNSKKQLTLFIIYINVVLYATCYQIQRPLEPFMVEKLNLTGDSSSEYAKLQSFSHIILTLCSFVSGRYLDYFGYKGGFIIVFLSCACSYYLLSQATTLNILYLSKLPTVFQSGFLCSQVAASQSTSDGTERVEALGRLTVSYTIGSIIGPIVGGYLGASGDYYYGAKLAVAGSLLSVLLTLFLPNTGLHAEDKVIKEELQNNDNSIEDRKNINEKTDNVPTIYNVVQLVWLFLSIKVISSVANAMAGAAMPLILKNTYGLNEQYLGLSMSFMSFGNAIVNGFFLGPIVSYMGGNLKTVISVCILSMCLFSLLQSILALPFMINLSISGGLYEYIGLTFVLGLYQYVLSTTITGESTAQVGSYAKGTLLGLEHSLFSGARVIAPQTGVYLLQYGGVSLVSGACSLVFGLIYILWKTYQNYQFQSVLKENKPKTIHERKEK